jgi:hypothetical protein
MRMAKRLRKAFRIAAALLVVLVSGIGHFSPSPVNAATLSGGSLTLSDSRPSQTSISYTADWDNVTTSAVKCIQLVFSDAATEGSVPTGMDTTSATLDGSSDYIPTPGSWSVDATTNGTVQLTYVTGETPAGASDRTVILDGITNGSTADTSYYLQFSTYNNTDCSSSGVDEGTVAFVFTSGQSVSLTVDPSLSFTIAGVASSQTVNGATTNVTTTATTVPLGTVTASTNVIGAHDLTVTTNAGSGYAVNVRYSAAPTSGSDTIDDHTGTNASPTAFSAAGTEAFGYTTNDSSLGTGTADRFSSSGGNKWAAFTTSNVEVAYSGSAVSSETTRAGYQVGIAGTTPAGNYTNTVIFTATPAY